MRKKVIVMYKTWYV